MTSWALARDRRVTCSSPARPYPLVVRRARGTVVEDLDANRYLDFTAGLTACTTGHCHPRVARAIKEQAEHLASASGIVLDCDPIITLARKLAELAPGEVGNRVLLTNHPTESAEAAIELARGHTGRSTVLAIGGASHLGPMGLLFPAAGKSRRRQRVTAPGRTVEYLPDHDAARLLQRVRDRLAAETDVAAVLVEPMLGDTGDLPLPPEFLPELRSLCDEREVLLVVDETQTGMGRTGRMFCCERYGVVPDVLLVARGLASGMPVCAVVAPETIMKSDWQWPGPTFSANPIVCAAALAVIELLERNLIANAAKLFPVAIGKLERIARRHSCISPPRGLGLMLALDVIRPRRRELTACELRDRIVTEAFHRGLLLLGAGPRTIRFTPPLSVNRVQLEVGLDVFEEAVATVAV